MRIFASIDAYIRACPKADQANLRKLRAEIRKAAPKAEEAIRYGMPTFRLYGNLVHFAVFRDHYSLFPSSSGVRAFKKDLKRYVTSKGTIQFPKAKAIPFGLVKRIVKFRIKENLAKQKK